MQCPMDEFIAYFKAYHPHPRANSLPKMNVGTRPSQTFIVLRHADHGSAQAENERHGGQHFRYLNVTGRWSAGGTTQVPLLTWSTVERATAAAVIASEARKVKICWSSVGGDSHDTLHIEPFGDDHAAALLGYLPYGLTKAMKLAEQRAKTLDFARAVLQVHQATTVEEFEQLEKSEGRFLVQAYRTSVFGARQFLTGKKAAEALRMLEAGEQDAEPDISIEDLRSAIKIAIHFDSLILDDAEARRSYRLISSNTASALKTGGGH